MFCFGNFILGMFKESLEIKDLSLLSESYNENLLSLEKLYSKVDQIDNLEEVYFTKLKWNYLEALRFSMENIFMKEILLGFKNFNNAIHPFNFHFGHF